MPLKVIVISFRRLRNRKLCGSQIVVLALIVVEYAYLSVQLHCHSALVEWMWHKIISPEH